MRCDWIGLPRSLSPLRTAIALGWVASVLQC
uniref:Uncharacterized protein n=1 Tax=Arundo donax TaxID=35708 RepID=A0A0A8XTS1_ARUDO